MLYPDLSSSWYLVLELLGWIGNVRFFSTGLFQVFRKFMLIVNFYKNTAHSASQTEYLMETFLWKPYDIWSLGQHPPGNAAFLLSQVSIQTSIPCLVISPLLWNMNISLPNGCWNLPQMLTQTQVLPPHQGCTPPPSTPSLRPNLTSLPS